MDEVNMFDLSVGDLTEFAGFGSVDKAITNSIYGLNNTKDNTIIPKPKIGRNRIFFTRPQLNMRGYNIATDKDFGLYLNNNPKSIGSVVRAITDPRLAYDYNGPASKQLKGIMDKLECPLINNLSPWIDVLSNTLVSFDGWTDLTMARHQSANDRLKGSIEIIDDTSEINTSNSFTATFMNMETDINRSVLDTMYKFQSKVRLGEVTNYWDFELSKTKAYNTRIYSIVTGPDDETILRWASTGPAIVTNVNMNTRFAYNIEDRGVESQNDFSAEFTAYGMRFNRLDILIDFNKTTSYFHPGVASGESLRRDMQRLAKRELKLFNHRAVPVIDIKAMKLLWFVERDYYLKKIDYWKKKGLYKDLFL